MSSVMQALGLQSVKPTDLTKYITVAAKETLERAAKAVIEDGKAWLYANERYPLSIKLGMTARQEGNGQPSPDNVRPIIGWTEAHLYVSPTTDEQDGDAYVLSWQTEAGTVYGGTLDVTTGELTVTHGFRQFDGDTSEVWYYLSLADTFYIYNSAMGRATDAAGICNMFSQKTTWSAPGVRFGVENAIVYFMGLASVVGSTDPSVLRSWLSANPLQIAFALDTPQTYQLTPTEVTTLLGVNNIWADCGPIIEVLY